MFVYLLPNYRVVTQILPDFANMFGLCTRNSKLNRSDRHRSVFFFHGRHFDARTCVITPYYTYGALAKPAKKNHVNSALGLPPCL